MALVKIQTSYTSLTLDQNNTITTADSTSGSSTLTVKNIIGFAINQILIVGQLGNQGTEIIKTHASTAPTSSTITLASNTVFPHSTSTIIQSINYDQVEVSTATTITGSKTVLATVNIVGDTTSTNYNDSSGSTGYYFARFKNSITSAFSNYSDPIPVIGYTIFSARSIIDSALSMINKSTSLTLSDAFAFQEIDNCQMECLRELKRWSFMQKFNANLGSITTGQWKVALPVDCDDQNSNKSIYNFRVGTGTNITWIDKEKWDDITQNVANTTLKNSISVNDVTITLTSSDDFNPTSGTITIGSHQYTYTANNLSTGVLTIPASTTTATAGADVFQYVSTGTPQYWTTYGGFLYFYPVLDSTLNGKDGHLDYYSSLVQTYNDNAFIVLPDPTVVQYFLAWKFLLKQNNGQSSDETENLFGKYEQRKKLMINKETANRTFQLKPLLNRFDMSGGDSKAVRLGNFQTQ